MDPSPNTVQLVGCDLVDGWVLGSGPGGVVGAFDVPFGHLSFDDAGLGAQAAGWVEPGEQAVEEQQPGGAVAASVVRGKKRRPGGRRIVG